MIKKGLVVGIIFLFIVSSIDFVGLETQDVDMTPVVSVDEPMDSVNFPKSSL